MRLDPTPREKSQHALAPPTVAAARKIVDLLGGEHPIEYRGRLELAVEVVGGIPVARGREQHRGVRRGSCAGRERPSRRSGRLDFAEPGRQRRPPGARLTGIGVHDEPHRVPRPFRERSRDHGRVLHRRSIADRCAESASFVNREDEAARALGAGARGNHLPRARESSLQLRGVDEAGQREAARPEGASRILETGVRTLRRALGAGRPALFGDARDRLDENSGPGRVSVGTDDARELRLDIGARGIAEVKPDRLSGTNRQAICISGQRQHGDWLLGSAAGVPAASRRYSHRNGRPEGNPRAAPGPPKRTWSG